jgi:hypothetical protein
MSERRPNRWLLSLLVLALAGVTAWAAAFTRDDVLRMSREGRSDSEILDAIHDSKAIFDLTADDIGGLRRAGVSEKVIEGMIATGTPDPASAPAGSGGDQSAADQGTSSDQEGQQDEAQPSPYDTPVVYPIYPLYYPVYYPVYDPFFPVYGGFFFSFGFVHFSNLFTIFPCDHAVVVVNRPLFRTSFWPRWSAFARGGSATLATTRVVPRGSLAPTSIASRTTPSARGAESRISPSRSMRSQGSWREPGVGGFPSRPRVQQAPPIRTPSAPGTPRSFQGMPRPPAQSFQRPGGFMAPRGGFPGRPQGGFSRPAHGGFAPRSFGGGHMGGPAGHGHGGHH